MKFENDKIVMLVKWVSKALLNPKIIFHPVVVWNYYILFCPTRTYSQGGK